VRTMDEVLREHPLFDGLDAAYLELLVGCGRNVVFHAGDAIARQGTAADAFYLIRHGQVAVQIAVPARGPVTIDTLGEGDVLGWSWLLPPYEWHFDVEAVELTRAVAFDVRCVRDKFETDPRLGYELLRRFAAIIVDRLQVTRLRLLDLYGQGGEP
jgi:CRP/FNR family cyclic AMP-dependent transcriptional regulator